MLRFFLAGVVLFFMLFPVKLTFFPISLNRLMGMLGMCTVVILFSKRGVPKPMAKAMSGYLLLFCVAVVTSIINSCFDAQFYAFLATPILNLFASLLVCSLISKPLRVSRLCDLIVCVQTFQAIISFMMFIIPSFNDVIYSIIQPDEILATKIDLIEYRLMGVGNAFFHAAATYGITMLVLALLPYLEDSWIYRHRPLYWFLVALMIVSGILSARTFMFVFIVIFIFIYLVQRNIFKMILQGIKVGIVLVTILVIFMKIIGNSLSVDRFEHMQEWAFELYEVYEETGELRTSSSDKVEKMYTVLPDNIETWSIGDACFFYKGSYYMQTDIGYLRHLFYWGILGSIIYWLVIARYYRITSKIYNDRVMSKFLFALFLWDVILNFKGIISMASFYLGLFLACGIMMNVKRKIEKNENISNHPCLQCREISETLC